MVVLSRLDTLEARADGDIRTKVNSILDNTSQLSALWGSGRLKTPLRCYSECFRLFFLSQQLHCSMHHVQMTPVVAYWEGIDWNAGLHWSAVIISINTLCMIIHITCSAVTASVTINCSLLYSMQQLIKGTLHSHAIFISWLIGLRRCAAYHTLKGY